MFLVGQVLRIVHMLCGSINYFIYSFFLLNELLLNQTILCIIFKQINYAYLMFNANHAANHSMVMYDLI